MEILAQRMRSLRKERHIRQEVMAEALGVSISAYRRYELNEREPAAPFLVDFADYFAFQRTTCWAAGTNGCRAPKLSACGRTGIGGPPSGGQTHFFFPLKKKRFWIPIGRCAEGGPLHPRRGEPSVPPPRGTEQVDRPPRRPVWPAGRNTAAAAGRCGPSGPPFPHPLPG